MNLVDFERTPVKEIYAAVEEAAASAGVEIADSELIGIVPRRAYEIATQMKNESHPGLVYHLLRV